MNMISTGAFLNEMDASTQQSTVAEKFAAVWEKKNAKAARAGGVSLMALSLAACGSSSDDTTASTDTSTDTTTTSVAADPFTLTPLTDIASATQAANGSLTATFRFTSGDDVVNGMSATMAAADTLIDGSTTDNDVLNVTGTGATAITTVNIETVNLTASSGTPNLDASAISGVNNINVSGTVAATIDNHSSAATVNLVDYTRVLTIDDTRYDGSTAGGDADVVNMSVSGATYGTTAATRSGIKLIADTGDTLETLNIESKGSAANDFSLEGGSGVDLSVVNITGATDASVRMANTDITGLTFNATDATGEVTLVVDRAGLTTTATNANLFSGIDNLMLVDSTTPAVGGDGGSVAGLTVGQKITFADDFNASVLGFKAATGTADTATIVLDNESASTDTDVAQINAQNIETLTIESKGFSTSSSTTAENLIDDLVGDATTITVTGDTSLDLDLNIDASTAARSVTVDASGNTAFVNIEAAAGAGATAALTVSYNITGTDGNDTLSLNGTGGTLTGGAGNDVLTGSALNDTISTGAGTDTVYATSGTDTVTFGAGVDTIIFGESDVTASAQTHTYDDVTDTGTVTMAAGDTLDLTVNGSVYSQTYATSEAATLAALVSTHAATVLANHGVTLTAADTNKDIVLTGAADGTAFTSSMSIKDAGVDIPDTVSAVAGVEGVTVATSITSFTTGAGGDVISINVTEMNAVTGVDFLISKAANITTAEAVTMFGFTNGGSGAVDASTNIIKVAFDNTINSAADMLAGMDATVTTKGSSTDAMVTVFYDADAGAMKVGLMTDETAEAVFDETGSAFAEIASLTMTSAEYTAVTADNFSFIA